MTTGLHAAFDVRLGAFDLSMSIEAGPGETVAVIGPNGAGKSTLLRCLAGLQPIDRGRISLGDDVLDDSTTGVRRSPQARRTGVVFQQHLLFPSMSVLDNVAFGMRARGTGRDDARRAADALLARVGLADRGAARPHELSGGQSQRVALARALAVEPTMLLLDEPLAALDATTRAEIRRELRTHLDGLTGCSRVLVTHDPTDAFALASRVVVLEAGRVTQRGTLADVAARPQTGYLADLVGINLVPAVVDAGILRFGAGAAAPWSGEPSGPVWIAAHPRAVRLGDGALVGRGWTARVDGVDVERDRVLVRVGGPLPLTAELSLAAAVDAPRPGDEVEVAIDLDAASVYPRS